MEKSCAVTLNTDACGNDLYLFQTTLTWIISQDSWGRMNFTERDVTASLSDHVRRVLVVLFADAFDEIGIRYEAPGQFDSPWLRICLRIVDRDLNVHVPDPRP